MQKIKINIISIPNTDWFRSRRLRDSIKLLLHNLLWKLEIGTGEIIDWGQQQGKPQTGYRFFSCFRKTELSARGLHCFFSVYVTSWGLAMEHPTADRPSRWSPPTLQEHRIARGGRGLLPQCQQSTHCLIILGCSPYRVRATVIVTVITVNPLFSDFRKATQKWRFSGWWSSPGILEYLCTAATSIRLVKSGVAWHCVSLTTLAPLREAMKLRWGGRGLRVDGMTQGQRGST